MFSSFFLGFSYPLRGLNKLFYPGLRKFVWIPVLINTVLFAAGFYWLGTTLYEWAKEYIAELPTWLAWLSWLVTPVLVISLALVAFYGFTLAANVVAAPFNGFLAERVESLLAPTGQAFTDRPLWQEASVAIVTELRKLGYFLIRILPLALLFLIPGINFLVAPLVWGGATAWLLALNYYDYPLGNHGLNFKNQRIIAKRNFWLTLGFGSCVLLMTLVPILNFLSMPSAVIGATLLSGEQRLLANSSN